jgi:hypothetical protein
MPLLTATSRIGAAVSQLGQPPLAQPPLLLIALIEAMVLVLDWRRKASRVRPSEEPRRTFGRR